MKKVTPEQIDRLYEYTRQRYVKYYDVQTELVDHLANAIETHWQTAPNDDFEYILWTETCKFGSFGFAKIEEQKTKEMRRLYNKLLWRKIKEFFTFPKIVITLCIVLSVFTTTFLLREIADDIMNYLVLSMVLCVLILMFFNWITYKRKNKKWLLEEIIMGYGYYAGLFVPLLHLKYFFIYIPKSTLIIVLFSAFITLFGIVMFLIFVYLPKNRNKYLIELYPEYTKNLQTT